GALRAALPGCQGRPRRHRARHPEAAHQGSLRLPRGDVLMARSNVADLAPEELIARLGETKAELFTLRFQHATGQLSNYRRIGQLKREVARLLTRIRELEIAAAEAEEAR